MLDYLDRVAARPAAPTPSRVAEALDDVAIACSPQRDLAVNPAKMLAIALADTTPVVWGGSVLAARAARRVAESIRRATGRSALAGDAEHLLPVLEAARPRDVFDDPFAERRRAASGARCCWCSTTAPSDPWSRAARPARRRRPRAACGSRRSPPTATHRGGPLRLAAAQGTYAAEYLRLGPGHRRLIPNDGPNRVRSSGKRAPDARVSAFDSVHLGRLLEGERCE